MQGLARAGFPVAPVRWYEPTGERARPAVLRDGLRRGRRAARRAGHGRGDGRGLRPDDGGPPRPRLAVGRRRSKRWPCGRPRPTRRPTSRSTGGPGIYRAAAAAPIPLLEEAAAWLHHRAPPLERLSVVHGDAGPGNVVQADGRIVAVTDWEFAHLGDPAEDWSFCLSMRGSRTLPRETWLELFDRVAGFRMDEAGLELLGGLQPLQGRLRQLHLPRPVRARWQPGAEHGHHRDRAAPFVPAQAREGGPPVTSSADSPPPSSCTGTATRSFGRTGSSGAPPGPRTRCGSSDRTG